MAPVWKIVGKSARLRKGDLTPDGQRVRYVDGDHRVYVDDVPTVTKAGVPLFKSEDRLVAAIQTEIERNISERLIKRVDQFGNDYHPCWKVIGSDGFALFKTREAAVAVIIKATVAPILKAYYGSKGIPWNSGTPDVPGGGGAPDRQHPSERLNAAERKPNFPEADDETLTHTSPGTQAPFVDDENFNADPNLSRQARKTLTQLHNESMRKRGRSNVAGRKAFLA